MSAMIVAGLAEVVLNLRDKNSALAFYRDLLGLTVISPPERANPVFLRAGAATAELPALVVLVQLPPGSPFFPPPRALHHLALAISADGFDDARAIRSGDHPGLPSRTMYVTDPDGNEVELIAALGAGAAGR